MRALAALVQWTSTWPGPPTWSSDASVQLGGADGEPRRESYQVSSPWHAMLLQRLVLET